MTPCALQSKHLRGSTQSNTSTRTRGTTGNSRGSTTVHATIWAIGSDRRSTDSIGISSASGSSSSPIDTTTPGTAWTTAPASQPGRANEITATTPRTSPAGRPSSTEQFVSSCRTVQTSLRLSSGDYRCWTSRSASANTGTSESTALRSNRGWACDAHGSASLTCLTARHETASTLLTSHCTGCTLSYELNGVEHGVSSDGHNSHTRGCAHGYRFRPRYRSRASSCATRLPTTRSAIAYTTQCASGYGRRSSSYCSKTSSRYYQRQLLREGSRCQIAHTQLPNSVGPLSTPSPAPSHRCHGPNSTVRLRY